MRKEKLLLLLFVSLLTLPVILSQQGPTSRVYLCQNQLNIETHFPSFEELAANCGQIQPQQLIANTATFAYTVPTPTSFPSEDVLYAYVCMQQTTTQGILCTLHAQIPLTISQQTTAAASSASLGIVVEPQPVIIGSTATVRIVASGLGNLQGQQILWSVCNNGVDCILQPQPLQTITSPAWSIAENGQEVTAQLQTVITDLSLQGTWKLKATIGSVSSPEIIVNIVAPLCSPACSASQQCAQTAEGIYGCCTDADGDDSCDTASPVPPPNCLSGCQSQGTTCARGVGNDFVCCTDTNPIDGICDQPPQRTISLSINPTTVTPSIQVTITMTVNGFSDLQGKTIQWSSCQNQPCSGVAYTEILGSDSTRSWQFSTQNGQRVATLQTTLDGTFTQPLTGTWYLTLIMEGVTSNTVQVVIPSSTASASTCTNGQRRSCFPQAEDFTFTYHQTCGNGIWGSCTPDYTLGILPQQNQGCIVGTNISCPRQFGVCQGSSQICIDANSDGVGEWPGCDYTTLQGHQAGPETNLADLLDNDCDGSIDEGRTCTLGETIPCGSVVGACTLGIQRCEQGTPPTLGLCNFTSAVQPRPEIADSSDNNCDGAIDEGVSCATFQIGQTRTCGTNIGACTQGIQTCTNQTYLGNKAWSTCEGNVLPQNELLGLTCNNGLDNDCDGVVDEGCGCVEEGTNRTCGSGQGICTQGVQTCTGGLWGNSCTGAVTPKSAEICGNGLDDTCDNSIDEGCPCIVNGVNYTEGITTVSCGNHTGVCAELNQTCNNGVLQVCNFNSLDDYASRETGASRCIDLLDNDCDGDVDTDDSECRAPSTSRTTCTDGTREGECSTTKPRYCSDGRLIFNAGRCGCPAGQTQQADGTCATQVPIQTTQQVQEQPTLLQDGLLDIQDVSREGNGPGMLIFVLIIILLVIGGVFGAYYYLRRKKQPLRVIPSAQQRPVQQRPTATHENVQELNAYIRKRLEKGGAEEAIKRDTLKAGWTPFEVHMAIQIAKINLQRRPQQPQPQRPFHQWVPPIRQPQQTKLSEQPKIVQKKEEQMNIKKQETKKQKKETKGSKQKKRK